MALLYRINTVVCHRIAIQIVLLVFFIEYYYKPHIWLILHCKTNHCSTKFSQQRRSCGQRVVIHDSAEYTRIIIKRKKKHDNDCSKQFRDGSTLRKEVNNEVWMRCTVSIPSISIVVLCTLYFRLCTTILRAKNTPCCDEYCCHMIESLFTPIGANWLDKSNSVELIFTQLF